MTKYAGRAGELPRQKADKLSTESLSAFLITRLRPGEKLKAVKTMESGSCEFYFDGQ